MNQIDMRKFDKHGFDQHGFDIDGYNSYGWNRQWEVEEFDPVEVEKFEKKELLESWGLLLRQSTEQQNKIGIYKE